MAWYLVKHRDFTLPYFNVVTNWVQSSMNSHARTSSFHTIEDFSSSVSSVNEEGITVGHTSSG